MQVPSAAGEQGGRGTAGCRQAHGRRKCKTRYMVYLIGGRWWRKSFFVLSETGSLRVAGFLSGLSALRGQLLGGAFRLRTCRTFYVSCRNARDIKVA